MNDIFEVGEVKNPVYADAKKVSILATIVFPNHPQLPKEGVPFLVLPEDPTEHGQQLWVDLTDGKYGDIGPYVEPKPEAPATDSTAA